MIYRRYITIAIFTVILCLSVVLFKVSPYVSSFPQWPGIAQGSDASYPLKSSDRSLTDLSGEWLAYNSLSAADTVYQKVYDAVYQGKGGQQPSVTVPGSWKTRVVAKQFFISNEQSGRMFRLWFVRLGSRAKVFVNGFSDAELIGELPASNVPAYLNIPTPRLKFGEPNVIVIQLEDQPAAFAPWFNFPGLTGEVYLETTGTIILGSPAVTTSLNGGGAEVNYQLPASVDDNGSTFNVQVNLLDAANKVVATNAQVIKLLKPGRFQVNGKLSVAAAHLWSPGDPYLYHLQVNASDESGMRDSYVVPLGLRQVKVSDSSVLLNGNKFGLKIIRRVNDNAESGGATNPAVFEADLKWAKAHGYNALYLPDSPPHPYLLDLADRLGLIVLAQTSLHGTIPGGNSQSEVAAVYTQLGYHPSLLAVGLGDELDLKNSQVAAYLQQNAQLGLTFYTTAEDPNLLSFTTGGTLALDAPYLADFIAARPSFAGANYSLLNSGNGLLTRERDEKTGAAPASPQPLLPPYAVWSAGVVAFFFMLRSSAAGMLRFSMLAEPKPKRKMRRQIGLQACLGLARLTVLGLITADLVTRLNGSSLLDYWIERLPWRFAQVFAWYILSNPLALCLTFVALSIIVSLLAIWPRTKTLPGKQSPAAVLLWLERRKRWFILTFAAWFAASSFGYAKLGWLVPGVMALGFLLSSFGVRKEIKKAGGKPYTLIYYGLGTLVILAFLIANGEKIVYSYHWLGY